ncbi:MAG TPA: hypothetical protein V6C58_17395 [Allocoleopsis sp.]
MIITLILGIFLVYVAWKTNNKVCPPNLVEYRFIPRTLDEEMQNPAKPSEVFKDMFVEADPLSAGFGTSLEKLKKTGIIQ